MTRFLRRRRGCVRMVSEMYGKKKGEKEKEKLRSFFFFVKNSPLSRGAIIIIIIFFFVYSCFDVFFLNFILME